MTPGKTYCLLGSSGVGKTTLINRLLGDGDLETREVSHTGEGRHTTTRRHLIVLAHGALLITQLPQRIACSRFGPGHSASFLQAVGPLRSRSWHCGGM